MKSLATARAFVSKLQTLKMFELRVSCAIARKWRTPTTPATRFHPNSTEPVTKDENRVSQKLECRTSRAESTCKVQHNALNQRQTCRTTACSSVELASGLPSC